MNILILGSQGFIGTHLCNYFTANNHNVVGVDVMEVPANINYDYIKVSRLTSQWDEIFKTNFFDVCINAAGSGNVSYSVSHPLIDFEANTLDVIKILDAIKQYQPTCKYIHLSSAAVYGNPSKLPISEMDNTQPISPYGYHKMMSEIICKEYAHLFNLKIAIIRPFSIFGNGLRKQLIWDICLKLKTNNTISLFGTGNETRDFIHISDFVQLINIVLEKALFNCDIFNAASGKETSINEVVKVFSSFYNQQKEILFNGETKPGDPINWCADINAIAALGFKPSANFNTSITNYITWFNSLHATN